MSQQRLQALCAAGQKHLERMEYLQAEDALVEAEALALGQRDFDTLARLYMPLQEARRQRRLRCGEGVVCLDLLASGPQDRLDPRQIVEQYPHGQLLVGGWGTVAPAVEIRRLANERKLYLETFLAAVYPLKDGSLAVAIAPLEDAELPAPQPRSFEELSAAIGPRCILLRRDEFPAGGRRGSAQTFSEVMSLWERLHGPFLDDARQTPDPLKRIEAYRKTIRVDYACELAHQELSDLARRIHTPVS